MIECKPGHEELMVSHYDFHACLEKAKQELDIQAESVWDYLNDVDEFSNYGLCSMRFQDWEDAPRKIDDYDDDTKKVVEYMWENFGEQYFVSW